MILCRLSHFIAFITYFIVIDCSSPLQVDTVRHYHYYYHYKDIVHQIISHT